MAGFDVDPEALRSAVNKLKQAKERVEALRDESSQLEPGELTAKDNATQAAYDAMNKRAAGSEGSLRSHSQIMRDKLDAKIEAYEETLREYEQQDRDALSGRL